MKNNKYAVGFWIGLGTGFLLAPWEGRKVRSALYNGGSFVVNTISGWFTSEDKELKKLQQTLASENSKLDHADRKKLLKIIDETAAAKKEEGKS